ncbi:MAG TPA: AmmeMemoRadiSam system protein B [Clostridiales bacterium]|nr:AmmeMemoRadiSam system protein B [Clostridiales bacterium]
MKHLKKHYKIFIIMIIGLCMVLLSGSYYSIAISSATVYKIFGQWKDTLLLRLPSMSPNIQSSNIQSGGEGMPGASFNQQRQVVNNLQVNEKRLQCRYYNEKDFKQSVNRVQLDDYGHLAETEIIESSIKGGIVPHHLLASNMIASFFKTISVEQPEVVIIIAPNHKGTGVKAVHTGSWSWQTPFGILEADVDIVNSLVDSKTADMNFDLLEEDHSIAGLVPYIKYYMPDTKIVPIMLHGSFGLQNAQKLGQNLQEKLENENKKSTIIASVDFSHYLPLEEARQMDEISIKAIENRDINIIQHFNNDYMDSPPSIIALLSAMNASGAEHMKMLDHSNSDEIAGARSSETTSYFTVVFFR